MEGIPLAVIAKKGYPSTVRTGAVHHPRVMRSKDPGTVQSKKGKVVVSVSVRGP